MIILRQHEFSAGYKTTMKKADKNFNPFSLRGKVGRVLNSTKAKQFDSIKQKALNTSLKAGQEHSKLALNHPSGSDVSEMNRYNILEDKYRTNPLSFK